MEKTREFIEGYKEGQKLFGETIASIINSLLLTIVYFIGVGLTSIFSRIFGKRFMDINIDKSSSSYWTDLNLNKKEKREYLRQF